MGTVHHFKQSHDSQGNVTSSPPQPGLLLLFLMHQLPNTVCQHDDICVGLPNLSNGHFCSMLAFYLDQICWSPLSWEEKRRKQQKHTKNTKTSLYKLYRENSSLFQTTNITKSSRVCSLVAQKRGASFPGKLPESGDLPWCTKVEVGICWNIE